MLESPELVFKALSQMVDPQTDLDYYEKAEDTRRVTEQKRRRETYKRENHAGVTRVNPVAGLYPGGRQLFHLKDVTTDPQRVCRAACQIKGPCMMDKQVIKGWAETVGSPTNLG